MLTHTRDKQYLHIKEAAAEFDVHPSTIRRAIHAGELQAVQLGHGGRYRVSREALAEFLVPANERSNMKIGDIGGRLVGKTTASDDAPLYTDMSGVIDNGYPVEHTSRPIGTISGEKISRDHDDAAPAAGIEGLDTLVAAGLSFVGATRDSRPSRPDTKAKAVDTNPKGKGRRSPTIW